jgi:general secretion pathway protein A
MYQEFFGFREPPFRITPDPRVLYRNRCYEEAIAALAYGIEHRKGFMSLVGEVGTGKTTLLRHVLETVAPNVRTVLLLYPTISFEEILEQVLVELGVPVGGSGKGVMLQRLHEFLNEHTLGGGNVALLFDEAQALDARTLEELRLISNFETGTEKIVQIVLAGQPELEEKLRRPEHRQLRQRIALHVRLRPLNAPEVADYVRVRLEHVDAPDLNLFEPAAMARIAELTAGIPRVVNVLCDACCTSAFALGRRRIDRAIVDETWADYAGLAPETTVETAAPEPFLPPPPPLVGGADARESPRRAPAPPTPPPFTAPSSPPPDLPEDEPSLDDEYFDEGAAGADERWPLVVAFAIGVVLAGFVMIQLLRQNEDTSDFQAAIQPPVAAAVPSTIVSSVPTTLPAVAAVPPAPPAPPPAATPAAGAISDAPPTPAGPAASPAAPSATGAAAPSAVDALDLVDSFRRAYEQRNVDALGELFAADARKGTLAGRDAIVADYRRFFSGARDLLYSQPTAAVEPSGDHVVVRAPFEITYLDAANKEVHVRGTAAWTIVRADGGTVIRSLDFEMHPDGAR